MKNKPKIVVTLDWLIGRQACTDSQQKFIRLFPSRSVVVTRARLIKYSAVFSVDWLACHLLTSTQLEEYKRSDVVLRERWRSECDRLNKKVETCGIACGSKSYKEMRTTVTNKCFRNRAKLLADLLDL